MEHYMSRAYSALPAALIRPDRTFAAREIFTLPRLPLLLLLFFVYVTGERLVEGYYQNEHAKTLAVLDVDTRMSGLLQNAPTQVQSRMRGQMLDSILGRQSGVMTAAGIAFSGVGFLLVLVEVWLVSLVAAQFFGGQEERHQGRRPSWTLFLVAFLPLALRKLAAGVVMALRNPDAAANALTLSDYRALSAARFDLLSLLPFGDAHGFFASAGRMLTDPFFLWTLAILCLGGREVYRIRMKGALGLCLVLVAALSLQSAFFAAVGLSWEI
jgi:hypothetical protein